MWIAVLQNCVIYRMILHEFDELIHKCEMCNILLDEANGDAVKYVKLKRIMINYLRRMSDRVMAKC